MKKMLNRVLYRDMDNCLPWVLIILGLVLCGLLYFRYLIG